MLDNLGFNETTRCRIKNEDLAAYRKVFIFNYTIMV